MRHAIVTLKGYEAAQAVRVALDRHAQSTLKEDTNCSGHSDNWLEGLDNHIVGSLGEIAYAKHVNRFWDGSVGTYKIGGDVGLVQIRTRTKMTYELIVRSNDRDEDWFVLARLLSDGTLPRIWLVGGILGKDAKQPKWLKTYGRRPPAFFVPDTALIPI